MFSSDYTYSIGLPEWPEEMDFEDYEMDIHVPFPDRRFLFNASDDQATEIYNDWLAYLSGALPSEVKDL